MYLEFKWLSIIAFNCSQWRSLPVSAGGWEALLILSDFLAYMMSSMRVIVKARTLHSDTSGACHREQSHTAPTLWQRAGTDSRIPHADWPKSKFTAWQSRIHLVATVWSRDPTMKGALWASTDISHPVNSRHQQSSHSEKARRGQQAGTTEEQPNHHVAPAAQMTDSPPRVRCLGEQANCGPSFLLILTSEPEHRQVIAIKSYSCHFVIVTLCLLTCDREGFPLLTVIQS